MQTTVTQNYSTGQKRPMCGLDYAMADIAAGRINLSWLFESLLT